MTDTDFYKILNLSKNASNEDIKQSYRKLAKIYHPDKNKNNDATEKFVKIKTAYDILIDNDTRANYDKMNIINKTNFFELVMGFVEKHSTIAHEYVNKLLNSIYENDDYLHDINVCRFDKVLGKIMEKLPYLNDDICNPLNLNICVSNFDIIEEIKCDLRDRYLDKYLYAKIKKKNCDETFKYIPLRNEIVIYTGDGEYDKINNINGNLIISVITENLENFKFFKCDLFTKIYVSKDVFNCDTFNFFHIDGSEISINKNDIIGKYVIIKNKGLPKQDNMEESFERGDLVVEIVNNF